MLAESFLASMLLAIRWGARRKRLPGRVRRCRGVRWYLILCLRPIAAIVFRIDGLQVVALLIR